MEEIVLYTSFYTLFFISFVICSYNYLTSPYQFGRKISMLVLACMCGSSICLLLFQMVRILLSLRPFYMHCLTTVYVSAGDYKIIAKRFCNSSRTGWWCTRDCSECYAVGLRLYGNAVAAVAVALICIEKASLISIGKQWVHWPKACGVPVLDGLLQWLANSFLCNKTSTLWLQNPTPFSPSIGRAVKWVSVS